MLANAPFDKFDRRQLFEFSDSLKNYLLLGDCHAGMFSATLRNLAKKNNVHLMQATADETFPVPGIRSVFQGPTQLMNYMYGSYLPDNLRKIDKVILAANYVSYGKKELTNYINQIDSFFSAYHVPIIVIGQTEGYCIEYPVVEVLHRRFGIHRSDYLLPARYHANQFLKCSKISERYIDVYNLPEIMHGDGYQAYLYDADHMSTFGTNQYEDLLQDRIFGGNPKP
ncbi:hypothetical protein GCM10017764_05160 [Sphingobacterium griseoflavum]|uniref:SGNH domain-containing protein n=1 Tax=Sphingobacterium griseoflavum TaxID=1474952 RepID=A0ABQ3HVY7_9SPHI|nr:hypothetical protein GCM10017764_05160 [Sphingobacterium griseoflavum]